ncbi:MAG: hypothetical protein ACMG57_00320, partial [Candidatus Dojkabacteria bacterium]
MKRLYRYIKKQIVTHKNSIIIEGVPLTLFLLAISFVMGINILRVITNGKSNYDTYLSEKKSLEEITAKNEDLNKENNFVSSDEYRKLILRETSNYAADNEQLFQTKEKPVYFDEQKQYLDLGLKKDYSDW